MLLQMKVKEVETVLQFLLRKKFHMTVQQTFMYDGWEACLHGEKILLLIPIQKEDEKTVLERIRLAQFMYEQGERNVCQFLQTTEGETIFEERGQKYCVLQAQFRKKPQQPGRALGRFHLRGKEIPFQVEGMNRLGRWKSFWERRIDQVEQVWNDRLTNPPENDFEQMFIESFPYYMGIAENAIQYLVDTEIDAEPNGVIDRGTICHQRFTESTWGDEQSLQGQTYKNPFHWVLDHFSRDLAEWTRWRYFKNIKTYAPDVREFFAQYRTVAPFSPFSIRLLYARLLFPLHYVECVEEYFTTDSEQRQRTLEENLAKYLKQSKDHELFLGTFFDLIEVPTLHWNIPIIKWLGDRHL